MKLTAQPRRMYKAVYERAYVIDRFIYQILELHHEIWKFEKKVVPLHPIL